ncbi:cytochrome-c peroxidase [Flavobacterium sp. J27]|uniref:cytochrome-c peroxidase n=1 Tax=Flavobacterium sp. J27 TaxID=2060419 RepID=UPI0013EE4126|nr:cytochrome c peroxidase [Flavobacterium sp. J27]
MLDFNNKQDYILIQNQKEIIIQNVTALQNEITLLHKNGLEFKEDSINLKTLQLQLTKTRKAYKKIEFILEYYYPEHVKEYINGPPFKHSNPNPIDEKFKVKSYYNTSVKEYTEKIPLDYRDKDHFRGKPEIVEPVGLQVLDEIIFSEKVNTQKELINQLTFRLQNDFSALQKAINERKYFYDYEILEAIRLELIRIFSLGITGFDTPGSMQAIIEAHTSLNALKEIVLFYIKQTRNSNYQSTIILFEKAIQFLEKNNNFNQLNRLHFLTAYINPLYKDILMLQNELGILSTSEKYKQIPSWNAKSENIFASNFLNPYYYTLLKEDDDNDSLRLLGKKIFYDINFSNSGKISCASCHNPKLAFTDGLPKSLSNTQGKTVSRNSPTLINAVFSDRFFYDLRAFDLEEQAEHVIENHLEFNTNYTEILAKINLDTTYTTYFQSLIKTKDKTITRSHFATALSSYVISLRSFNSEFDQYIIGKTKNIKEEVKRGFNLFMGKANCATCHFPPTFSGLVPPLYRENESEVLGVFTASRNGEIDPDLGRFKNNHYTDKFDIYRNAFKTTSVRNTKLTAPYFHNGAYKTLEEVIDFYNEGGASGMGLSYELPNQTLPSEKLHLNKREIKDIIAFLNALTDNPFSE